MRLIAVRHGETIENVKRIMQGHKPGNLTEKGIQQAKEVAEKLKDEKIDIIYSSDLKRAADTTKEIVKYHPDVPVHMVFDLREKNHGNESVQEFFKRAKGFFDKVIEEHSNDTVLFVCHGGIIHSLRVITEKRPVEDISIMEKAKHTAVLVFGLDEKNNLISVTT